MKLHIVLPFIHPWGLVKCVAYELLNAYAIQTKQIDFGETITHCTTP